MTLGVVPPLSEAESPPGRLSPLGPNLKNPPKEAPKLMKAAVAPGALCSVMVPLSASQKMLNIFVLCDSIEVSPFNVM